MSETLSSKLPTGQSPNIESGDLGNQPYIVSTVDESPETLRERFQQWGYLYIKGYVDTASCKAMRDALLGELQPYIVFDQAQQLPVSTGTPFVESDPIWDEVYPRIQSLESFHSFFHQRIFAGFDAHRRRNRGVRVPDENGAHLNARKNRL